jgi:hypothetical protein
MQWEVQRLRNDRSECAATAGRLTGGYIGSERRLGAEGEKRSRRKVDPSSLHVTGSGIHILPTLQNDRKVVTHQLTFTAGRA